ncbi:MAG: 16S rRNA (guanine(966)-N(2))-methyltransferase RsmD [Myxococcota bacterium]
MRIIAGKAGGRRLANPEHGEIRPTPDRVKEALFSIVGNLNGAIVADGFAGTGALGCEALSRGASQCYFIDQRTDAIELIEENLEIIDARDKGIILEGEFTHELEFIVDDPDLWFLDPPYNTGLGEKALQAMADAGCVTDRALVVLEQEISEAIPEIEGFRQEDAREYGRTRLTFFRFVTE